MGSRVRASSAPQRERNSVSLSFFIPPLACWVLQPVGFLLRLALCVLRFAFCTLCFAFCTLCFVFCVLRFVSCVMCFMLLCVCSQSCLRPGGLSSSRRFAFVLEACLRPGGLYSSRRFAFVPEVCLRPGGLPSSWRLAFVLEVCIRPGGFCRENLPSGHKKKGDAFPWTSSLSGELLQGNLMPPLSAQSLIRLCNSHTRGILCGT